MRTDQDQVRCAVRPADAPAPHQPGSRRSSDSDHDKRRGRRPVGRPPGNPVLGEAADLAGPEVGQLRHRQPGGRSLALVEPNPQRFDRISVRASIAHPARPGLRRPRAQQLGSRPPRPTAASPLRTGSCRSAEHAQRDHAKVVNSQQLDIPAVRAQYGRTLSSAARPGSSRRTDGVRGPAAAQRRARQRQARREQPRRDGPHRPILEHPLQTCPVEVGDQRDQVLAPLLGYRPRCAKRAQQVVDPLAGLTSESSDADRASRSPPSTGSGPCLTHRLPTGSASAASPASCRRPDTCARRRAGTDRSCAPCA